MASDRRANRDDSARAPSGEGAAEERARLVYGGTAEARAFLPSDGEDDGERARLPADRGAVGERSCLFSDRVEAGERARLVSEGEDAGNDSARVVSVSPTTQLGTSLRTNHPRGSHFQRFRAEVPPPPLGLRD